MALQAGVQSLTPTGPNGRWRQTSLGVDVGLLVGYPERHRFWVGRVTWILSQPSPALMVTQTMGYRF